MPTHTRSARKTAARKAPAKGAKKASAKRSKAAPAHGAKKTSGAKKTAAANKAPKKRAAPKRWVKTVTTDSTHPPQDLFTKSASVIARSLASKKVSPKGPASGMRMLVYFINRGGRGLSAARRRELEKAKQLLSARIQREKENS